MWLYIFIPLALLFSIMMYLSYRIFRNFFMNPHKRLYRNRHYLFGAEQFMNYSPVPLEIENGGLKLRGYYLPTEYPVTVILLHGWQDESISMMSDAVAYYNKGYSVFVPDLRSHGKSEGRYIGMGVTDRSDIIAWIDHLKSISKAETVYVLDGFSMGGAAALALSGDPALPSSVKAIISDGAYTSIKDLLIYRLSIQPLFIRRSVIWFMELWCRMIIGYTFSEYTPLWQVAGSKTPTLFVHGTKDDFASAEMSERLFDSCSADKEYWLFRGATHGITSGPDMDQYIQKKIGFINKSLGLSE
ncbi:MAG: alpha/beta hydrolase [Clostridia bacterium]